MYFLSLGVKRGSNLLSLINRTKPTTFPKKLLSEKATRGRTGNSSAWATACLPSATGARFARLSSSPTRPRARPKFLRPGPLRRAPGRTVRTSPRSVGRGPTPCPWSTCPHVPLPPRGTVRPLLDNWFPSTRVLPRSRWDDMTERE